MREFSSKLKPENKGNFKTIFYDRMKCYLRRDLYEHILSHDENDYFSLDDFNKRVRDMEMVKQMVSELVSELEELGWKCKTSFGGTGLFIYSTELPPPSCWEEAEPLS
jgi:hypothetical protein